MRNFFFLAFLLASLPVKAFEVQRLHFGSCNDQTKAQPLWKKMLEMRTDLFIWGGDIVYADRERGMNLRRAYQRQLANKDYQEFRSRTKIIGIWDDHDFGGNNFNGTNPRKRESQKLLLDFLQEPASSPRRSQEGIYVSYTFGKIKFILLDNRYFLDLDPNAPLLGEKQWKWLEKELSRNQSRLTFIVTGVTVLSPRIPFSDSSWGDYPSEKERLINLINGQQKSGIVLLTGDMHFASIMKKQGHLEFLSSGMTHTANPVFWWFLARKYQNIFFGPNYGQIDIAWEGNLPVLTLSVRSVTNLAYHKKIFRLDEQEWVEDVVSPPFY